MFVFAYCRIKHIYLKNILWKYLSLICQVCKWPLIIVFLSKFWFQMAILQSPPTVTHALLINTTYINTDVHTHIDRSIILSQFKKRSRHLNYNIACKFFFDHVSLGMSLFHFADFSHPYCLFSDSVWWLSSVLLVFPTIYPGLISPLPLGSTLGSLEISVWFSVYLWNLLLKTLYLLQESYCLALL